MAGVYGKYALLTVPILMLLTTAQSFPSYLALTNNAKFYTLSIFSSIWQEITNFFNHLFSYSSAIVNSSSQNNQNRALANCTSQVNSAINILSDKWMQNSQISIVNTSIFVVANTAPTVNVTISEPTAAYIYNDAMQTVRNNLTTKINPWISEWASETGEQGSINCYQNGTRAGSYVCQDLKEIALSNDTIAIGEIVRIAGNNGGGGYSIVLPVLCDANGNLLPNSKGLIIGGSSNGDFLDA